MADFVTLMDAKAHCRVDSDDEDALIDGYLKTAIAMVSGANSATGVDVAALPLGSPKRDIAKQAALMLISHWYANREAVLVGETAMNTPISVEMLINMIRVERF